MASPRGEEGLLTGLRHVDLAHKPLSDIPAWRRGLLTGLRHGTPVRGLSVASRHGEAVIYRLFGTATPSTSTSVASSRGEGGFYRPFGTGTLNRTTSGAGSRGKTVWNRCQTGLLPMLRPDFGTASPAGGLSVASRRGEAVIYRLFGTATPSTSTSVASSRGEGVF